MGISAISTLLSQTIGLDPDTIGLDRIARAAETRRVSCELLDLKSYWARLQTSSSELEELVEQLIVPETWFFRDSKPFDYLKTYITSEWLLNPRNPLQLLSVPCSTGEEPYSLAISLLQAGLHPRQFAIDAIDISHRSLVKAKRGVYTKNSFRGNVWVDRDRYFQQTAEGYELCQPIRQLVNFQQSNVMTALALIQKQYDIIFCRNLLIYLQSEACSRVLKALDRLLTPGGLLFVGASETGKIIAPHYSSVRQPFTFAYRKLEAISPQVDSPTAVKLKRELPIEPAINQISVKQPGKSKNSSTFGTQPTSQNSLPGSNHLSPQSLPVLDLKSVRRLADEGRSTEAVTLCQAYLVHHPTSAAAYTLLGELYQADQQTAQAGRCFQRAIYLEPNAYEALVHLALSKEQQGDTAGAEIIRQRIERLQHSLKTEA